VSFSKRKLSCLILLILVILLAIFFKDTATELSNFPLEQQSMDEEVFSEKIDSFNEWQIENKQKVGALYQKTEELKMKDRDLDELIRAADKRLNLDPEEFNNKYPDFDKDGQY
jgi:hypothetical protein